jgi:1-hydroxy-2-isopentenylcarotenoid 3,4-desaturase
MSKSQGKNKKVIVIGAGFGGLSTAAMLAKEGFSVTVLEKNKQPGGRAMVLKEKGYQFDMGPSWYTMPDVFDEFFAQFGKKVSDYYTLKRLSPSYRIFFGKDDYVDMPVSKKDIYKLFDELEPDGSEKLKKYLSQAEYQYVTAMKGYIKRDYRTIFDMFDIKMAKESAKLHLFENMDKFTKRFFKSEKAQKILQYTLVFLGGSPKKTPALYALMSHIDINLGIWYPIGGLGAVVNAIVKLGKENGVKFKYSTEVKSIKIVDGKAVGVQTENGFLEADYVVSNADYAFTENSLLPEKYQSYKKNYWEKKTLAPSAFIAYLGMDKKYPQIKHHSLFFHNDWTEHFDSIFDDPGWPDKPSYYVNKATETDKGFAPKGCDTLFILVPIASGIKDTNSIREKYLTKILKDMESVVGEDISGHVKYKKILSLNDYKSLYNSYKGTAIGLSHTLFQTAYFRPHIKSKKVKNLYYAGQFTHPGIGVPTCIISGEIAANLIKNDK